MLAACGGEKKGSFGDTPNPGRAAAPPASLTCNQFRRRAEKSLFHPARSIKRKDAKRAPILTYSPGLIYQYVRVHDYMSR